MQLWDFQEQAVADLRSHIKKPYQPGVFVAPTGSGKSEIFGWMARSAVSLGKRVGVAVNRRILVKDLCKRVASQGVEYGVVMGSVSPKPWAPVQVMSLDTLWRREYLPKIDILYIDEAHFSLAEKYLTVVERYIAMGIPVIGMTATPVRGLGEGLGPTYKWMVRAPDTPELIRRGYLVPPRVFSPSKPNMKGVEIVGDEYNKRQLEEACDREALVGDILKHYQQNLRGKPAIGFGVSIKHCQHMTEIFTGAGIRAVSVDHKYKGDLDLVWSNLANYDTEIVFNVNLCGYGFNVPEIEGMVSACPYAGLGRWLQCCGRVMRTCKRTGKIQCVINDHSDNSRVHGLPSWPREWSLDSKRCRPMKDEEAKLSVSTCRSCFFTFKSGPRECPDCGAPMPDKSRKIEVIDGELVEMKDEALGIALPEIAPKTPPRHFTWQEKYKLFEEYKATAEREGYSPMWVKITYSRVTGQFPPKTWGIPDPSQMKQALNELDREAI
jgi:DNA repair protein RadD